MKQLFPAAPLFGMGILLFLIPILACTRSVSSPQELTAIAEHAASYQSTLAEEEENAQTVVQTSPTACPDNSSKIETVTPSAAVTSTAPPIRSTYPVEAHTQSMQISATPQSVTPQVELQLPELKADFSGKSFYVVQTGDTANAIATRFGTDIEHISGLAEDCGEGFLRPGTQLIINAPERSFSTGTRILPDEYVIMGYPSIGYDLDYEVQAAAGYLASYVEYTPAGNLSGSEIIQKVATDYSISPIILLELLEYKSHWISGTPQSIVEEHYPLGWLGENSQGLYKQLTWAAGELSAGYYGWRYGTLSEIPFYKNPQPETPLYFNPALNAGSAAVQYLFAQLYPYTDYEEAIYGENGFLQQFYLDFGNVWDRYIPDPNGFNDRLVQPALDLPFYEEDEWCLTGGPHEAWTTGSPLGALDFAPRMAEHGCARSNSWITASAPGLVIRNGVGTVVVDLDMDGHEETGWVLYYLHVGTEKKAEPGTVLELHDRIGHPSCEGGNATGTHLHIARKYNGEWVNAYGPLPFELCGWIPFGGTSYKGGIQRGDDIIYAQQFASTDTLVSY